MNVYKILRYLSNHDCGCSFLLPKTERMVKINDLRNQQTQFLELPPRRLSLLCTLCEVQKSGRHIDIGGTWCFTSGRIIHFVRRCCIARINKAYSGNVQLCRIEEVNGMDSWYNLSVPEAQAG